MGFVSSLKFDRHSGAVLVNEEFMNIRIRRKMFLDAAQSLLTPEMADAWGIEAVYAGCGSPSVNQEIIDGTRTALATRFAATAKGKDQTAAAPTVKDIGLMAGEVLQRLIHRDMDLKLHLFYGFTGDDLNRGSFSSDGSKFEIKQDKVKTKAHEILNNKYADRNTPLYNDTRGHIFGFDPATGISAYHLDVTNGNVGFNMEAYECLGHGKYALETSMAKFLNNVTYPMRQRGYCRLLGIYELFTAALAAREAFHCTGGNLDIVYVDGSQATHAERYREFNGEASRVAMHVVQAAETGYVTKKDAFELIDAALFEGRPRRQVEEDLFRRANNPRALDFVLRGYKVHEVAEMAATWDAEAPRPAASKRRNKK